MVRPTEDELQDVRAACARLWDLDENRLTPREDYEITLGAAKSFHDRSDAASDTLFERVDDSIFRRPTYGAFKRLLDNYEWQTGVSENETAEEREEVKDFIEAVMDTSVFRYVLAYVNAAGVWSGDEDDFKRELHRLWFSGYRRGTSNDSSGFEHVFVGECKQGKVTGCHNWLAFHQYELQRLVDYRGLIGQRREYDDSSDDDVRLVTLNFVSCDGESKDVSSMFLGTSPEFELALYTLAFMTTRGREGKLRTSVGGYPLILTVYKIADNKVGSVFPEAPRD